MLVQKNFSFFDRLLAIADNGLRTVLHHPSTDRTRPDAKISPAELSAGDKKHVAGLMRVNHAGEVCAQALYQGQALTARNPAIRASLEHSAQEENDHLNWCANRLNELGSRTSLLNPLWYSGSLALGITMGLIGDKWSLGFLAETEHQVCQHLQSHLSCLPENDHQSRAIIQQMHEDESKHAETAMAAGAAELPAGIKWLMRQSAKVMTKITYFY